MAGNPDPKPAKRMKASRWRWSVMRELLLKSGTRCVGCGTSSRLSLHHVVPKSLGGDDLIANLVPLCGSGTEGCHGIYEGRLEGWEAVADGIRAALSPIQRAFVVRKKSEEWLDRYYPAGPRARKKEGAVAPSSSLQGRTMRKRDRPR